MARKYGSESDRDEEYPPIDERDDVPDGDDEDVSHNAPYKSGDSVRLVTRILLRVVTELVSRFEASLTGESGGGKLPTITELIRLYPLVEALAQHCRPTVLEVRWLPTIVNPESKS